MAPIATKPAAKRKGPAFKPPRPRAAKASKKASASTRQSKTAHRPRHAPSDEADEGDDVEDDGGDSDDDVMDEPSRISQSSDDPSEVQESSMDQEAPPSIPPALLTKLLHHHFQDNRTRIGGEARGVVGKYMETFVREAIARAAFERQSDEKRTRGVVGDDFLEVVDLEKLAPQLLLDF